MSIVNSNDVTWVKKGEIFARERRFLLNMESKNIQKRKTDRGRATLIYMSAIISALQDYLLGNWMTFLKLVTVATASWLMGLQDTEHVGKKQKHCRCLTGTLPFWAKLALWRKGVNPVSLCFVFFLLFLCSNGVWTVVFNIFSLLFITLLSF